MANPMYLAMTAAEYLSCGSTPENLAWMACHFSPYGRGISNIPKALPEGSILMLNDRIEPTIHDASLVALELEEAARKHRCSAVILDFQRPGSDVTAYITKTVLASFHYCPTVVSHHYAQGLDCGVLLSLPPMRCELASYLEEWMDREIWLDVYDQWEQITIGANETLSSKTRPRVIPALSLEDFRSSCRYSIDIADDAATFTLHRGITELNKLEIPNLNFIGLWQEYGNTK